MSCLDLDQIEKLMKEIPNWQRSRFVDSSRYEGISESWKDERQREERKIIRGAGIVGTPECNVLFKVEGMMLTEEMMEFIADAPAIVRGLLAELGEARDRLDDARDAIERIE